MTSNAISVTHTKLLAAIAAAKFPPSHYATHLNLNGERNFGVQGLYPDIVAIKKASGEIAAIVAVVETEDSVTQAQAASWRDYAALGYPFYLFVPALAYSAARDLVLRPRIAAKQVLVYRYAGDKIMLV